MSSDKQGVFAAIDGLFREDCKLPKNAINEKGRSFGVSKNRSDTVVGYEVDGCLITDNAVKRCDGLFFVKAGDDDRFAIAMVELKGGDAGRALGQFEATAQYLKKLTACGDSAHPNVSTRDNCDKEYSHGGVVLAYLISRARLRNSHQLAVKNLRLRHKVKVIPTGLQKQIVSPHDIIQAAFGLSQ